MDPLTPPDCDLRDFAFMPLDVVRLRDSDIAALSSGDEFRCAVLLWCASWHQLPAASLPDDDQILSQLAGFGRVVKEWKKVRSGALRGWIVCSDGRLYHPVVAEKAREAWRAKLVQRWKTECARIKKANQRNGTTDPAPSLEDFLAEHEKKGQPKTVPEDNTSMSPGTTGTCPQGQPKTVPEDSPLVSPICPSGNGIQGTVDRDSGQVNLKPKPLSGGVHSSTSEGSENASSPPPDGPDPITLRAIELSALLHQRGAALQASDPRVRAWAERGISDAQALTALETAETRRAEKGSSQAVNAGLLDAILSDLATDSPPRNRPPPAPRSPTLSDQRRAAATTRLSDVINDDGTPKPQLQKGFDDARTLDANAPRLVG